MGISNFWFGLTHPKAVKQRLSFWWRWRGHRHRPIEGLDYVDIDDDDTYPLKVIKANKKSGSKR